MGSVGRYKGIQGLVLGSPLLHLLLPNKVQTSGEGTFGGYDTVTPNFVFHGTSTAAGLRITPDVDSCHPILQVRP